MKNFKAFTLNELLITIAIITILSTVMIVGLTSLAPYWRLSGSTKEMMINISETQGYSVSQQVIHKIVFDLENGSYQIRRRDTSASVYDVVRSKVQRDIQYASRGDLLSGSRTNSSKARGLCNANLCRVGGAHSRQSKAHRRKR